MALFRRTVSATPFLKRLLPVQDLADQPIAFGIELGQLCPDVMFRILEDETGARYWAKQWLNNREPLLQPTRTIESFLATLGRDDLTLSIDHRPEFGLIYPFDERLFSSIRVVHHWDCRRYFELAEYEAIGQLANCVVRWPGLPEVPLGRLTDFQVARFSRHLLFLDFEPSRQWALQLAGVAIP
ncbi:MAG: hypothetical protein JO270_22825 [Acidobacteriaceae bacterium]|nr:hypothetical protein [Acidobacteriaceae bacterium]